MCGFAGIINSAETFERDRIADFGSKVSFRGPDSCGIRILDENLEKADSGNTAIFFNRLAIIDLDIRSDQPFEDGRHLLVFNGEIYNYPELKKELEGEGFLFTTTSDTEVLFLALKHWGEKALHRLNGMFSFFWLDKSERRFLLARDRVGIKPLYYQQHGSSLSFGSELSSILRFSPDCPVIDRDAVQMYLRLLFIPTPFTIIEGIRKLPPGTYIAGTLAQLNGQTSLFPKTYWDAYDFAASNGEDRTTTIETVLTNSLGRQLHADVPLGLFLSSGVDSSLLVALVNKHFAKTKAFDLFTVAFDESTFPDESREAADYIRGFNNPNLRRHTVHIDPEYFQQHLNELYQYYDEPFGDSAALMNWAVSKKAREYVTVAISGDGADELFWGYPRYNRWEMIGKLNPVPSVSNTLAKIAGRLPDSVIKYKLLLATRTDSVVRHFDQFIPNGMRFFLNDPVTKYPLWALENIDVVKGRKDLVSILDIRTYLADDMLYKVDRSSMASSLEVRVPFLDNEVIEYALRLPLIRKSNEQYKNKAVLKEMLMQLAPHYDINRPKRGFSFPKKKWLKENWKEQVLAKVTADGLIAFGLDPKIYLPIVHDFYEKETHYTESVWYLFNLMLWKDSFDDLLKHRLPKKIFDNI